MRRLIGIVGFYLGFVLIFFQDWKIGLGLLLVYWSVIYQLTDDVDRFRDDLLDIFKNKPLTVLPVKRTVSTP
jgi:hypothetical protein